MKKFVSLILSLMVLLSTTSIALANESTELIVGINAEYPPFESIQNGEFVGFDIELMQELGKAMGYSIIFKNVDFDSLIRGVADEIFDCAISGITVTEERKQILSFSDEYITRNVKYADETDVTTESYAIAVDKNDSKLLQQINNALSKMKDNGILDEMIKKYNLDKTTYYDENYNIIPSESNGLQNKENINGDVPIDHSNSLVIGITDFDPFNYWNEDGELIGFDTELAEYVCKKIGATPEFVEIDWSQNLENINSGLIDCIWNAFSITDESKMDFDVSYPYYAISQVIVTNTGANISLETLNKLSFAVETGSFAETALKGSGVFNFLTCNTQMEALEEVAVGNCEACVLPSQFANKYVGKNRKYPQLTKTLSLNEDLLGIGFKKGNIIVDDVNKALIEAKADGTLAYLGEKYGVDVIDSEIPNKQNGFYDVPTSHWAYKYINEMTDRGVLSGYGNGKFGPDDTITRAEFATIMCRAGNIQVTSANESSYVDVSTNDWYSSYIESGKYYLSGYVADGQKYYRPNENALREDIAVALVKLKGYDTSSYDENSLKNTFSDWQSINSGARKYVYAAVNNGLISGYEDGTFQGQANITRAEAATLFYKAYQY